MINEIYPNGCGILSINDINAEKISLESLKKDLIDWCKADRKKWLVEPLNAIYANLYKPTRDERFNSLSEEEKKKPFGINMDIIKINAMIRYNIERIKMYGSPEKFIEKYGEFIFNRIFCKPEKNSKLDLRWEIIENKMNNGFD
jgi:hypothetical protein